MNSERDPFFSGLLPNTVLPFLFLCAAIHLFFSRPLTAHSDPDNLETIRVELREERVKLFVNMDAKWLFSLLDRSGQSVRDLRENEMRRVRREITTLFTNKVPVRVNRQKSRPQLEDIYFNPHFRRYEHLAMLTFSFEAPEEWERFRLTWNLFPEEKGQEKNRDRIPVILDGPGFKRTLLLTPASPTLRWRAPGTAPVQPVADTQESGGDPVSFPVLSIFFLLGAGGCLLFLPDRHPLRWSGAGFLLAGAILVFPIGRIPVFAPDHPLPEKQAEEIFENLLVHMYRAYDYDNREDMYDTLDQSADGPFLTDIFLEADRSRRNPGQQNTKTHIQNLHIQDMSVSFDSTDDGKFRVNTRYRVYGSIEHESHVHSRVNEYRGLFTVTRQDDRWQITDVNILEHRRYKRGDDV